MATKDHGLGTGGQSLILLAAGGEEPSPGGSGNVQWGYRATTLAGLLPTSEPRASPGLAWLAGPSPCVECELEDAHASFQADIWVVFPRLLPTHLPK